MTGEKDEKNLVYVTRCHFNQGLKSSFCADILSPKKCKKTVHKTFVQKAALKILLKIWQLLIQ
jgi:hypothetical protein